MIEKGYYLNKKQKLIKQFKKTSQRYNDILSEQYGAQFAQQIIDDSRTYFDELIPNIPFYDAASYQGIILLNAQVIAIIRAMEKNGKTVEDTVRVQVELFKEDYGKIPSCVGRVFTSKVGGFFLNRLAQQVTKEGWYTDYIKGETNDDFDVSIVTKNCGVIRYLESENMQYYAKYCNFSDFIMFREMNIGLTQPMEPKNGNCVFCMKYKGKSKIPNSLDIIYTKEIKEYLTH